MENEPGYAMSRITWVLSSEYTLHMNTQCTHNVHVLNIVRIITYSRQLRVAVWVRSMFYGINIIQDSKFYNEMPIFNFDSVSGTRVEILDAFNNNYTVIAE